MDLCFTTKTNPLGTQCHFSADTRPIQHCTVVVLLWNDVVCLQGINMCNGLE